MAFTKKFLLILTLVVALVSCKKEFSPIGLNMENELLGTYMDTTAIVAYSVLHDSLVTTNLSNQVLGEIHDPVFGTTTGSVYSQFVLTGEGLYLLLPDYHPVFDSVVLTLQIANFYGDTTAPLSFGVYELDEDLEETVYYSHSTTAHKANNLCNDFQKYYIRPNTPLNIDGEVLSPHIRIRLDNNFGQFLFERGQDWLTDEDVLNEFKGLYIEALSNHVNGCMLYCNMTSALTGVTLYYHTDIDEHLSYTFATSEEDVRYNHFDHNNYQDAYHDLYKQIIEHNVSDIEALYLQAAGGVKTKIQFPNISRKFAQLNKKVVINRAELVITNCHPTENIFHQPANLAIQGVGKDGTFTFIPDDDAISSAGFFGGTYNATTGEYRIRITQYFQSLISSKDLYEDYFYLTVKGAGIRANRLVFYGSDPGLGLENKALRVEIAYTTY